MTSENAHGGPSRPELPLRLLSTVPPDLYDTWHPWVPAQTGATDLAEGDVVTPGTAFPEVPPGGYLSQRGEEPIQFHNWEDVHAELGLDPETVQRAKDDLRAYLNGLPGAPTTADEALRQIIERVEKL